MGRLDNVLWIGGPPGTGKTTVASILARRHGLRLYSADTRTWIHRDRAIAAGNVAAIRWEGLSVDERRGAPDDELLAMSLHAVRGSMVVDDVRELPDAPLILAEGSVIHPADLPADANAVWLLSDAPAAAARVRQRDGATNRLYELLADVIAADVAAAGSRAIHVTEIAEAVAAVEEAFAERIARGPVAESVETRRALLREANIAIVEQVRGYYARPWAKGDPDTVVRPFFCECGRRDCVAFPVADVGTAAGRRVIEDRHTAP